MSNVTRGCGAVVTLVLGLTAMALSLAAQAPPPQGRGAAPGQGRGGPPPGRGGGFMGAGPSDLPAVDSAAAARGKTVYAAQCTNCHGEQARGTPKGANLIRSLVVLKDRQGSELGPFLKKGHPTPGGSASLTEEQIVDLSHFLRQRVNDSLRGSPIFQPQNVLTGDAKAGAAFFNGAGNCSTCHGQTSSLAGIGTRLSPIDLQQRFLFPRTGRGRGAGPASSASAVTVTVTPPAGPAVSGVVVQMDDFNVSLRDASGTYYTFKRTPELKVEKKDPLAAHIALLDTITDKQMHDVVAYLETLK
jgi:cytochrome c oxidase cbb3-type subunit III